MGKLTDALKTYKRAHPEIALSESGFKLTPLHAHILTTAVNMDQAGAGVPGGHLIHQVGQNLRAEKTPVMDALDELKNNGMMTSGINSSMTFKGHQALRKHVSGE